MVSIKEFLDIKEIKITQPKEDDVIKTNPDGIQLSIECCTQAYIGIRSSNSKKYLARENTHISCDTISEVTKKDWEANLTIFKSPPKCGHYSSFIKKIIFIDYILLILDAIKKTMEMIVRS